MLCGFYGVSWCVVLGRISWISYCIFDMWFRSCFLVVGLVFFVAFVEVVFDCSCFFSFWSQADRTFAHYYLFNSEFFLSQVNPPLSYGRIRVFVLINSIEFHQINLWITLSIIFIFSSDKILYTRPLLLNSIQLF